MTDSIEARIVGRLREWYEFSERAKTDLAGSAEAFDPILGDLIVAGKVTKIVVQGKTYYRLTKLR